MAPDRSGRLDRLTARWRERHETRMGEARAAGAPRALAEAERESLAAAAFPFRSMSAVEYVARHGDAMIGFTYDDERYRDAELQAWIDEVGGLLRARRSGP
jgi:hypothetical protein